MERLLPYLLIVILLIGGWNESFKARFDRLTGGSQEQPAQEVAAETTQAPASPPVATPRMTPKPTPRYTPTPVPSVAPAVQSAPFFNDPSYHNTLDRGTSKKTR